MKSQTKKTIAILGEDLSVKGGITSVLRAYLASPLREQFHLIHLPTLIEGSSFGKLRIFGRAFFRLLGLLLSGKIDLVHIHSSAYASFYRKSLLALVAKIFRRPVIFHLHGSRFHHFFHHATPFAQKWISWTLNHVDQIIVLSHSWRARVSEMTRNSKILVLNNPVNAAEMRSVRREQTGHFTILFLGELTRRKGIWDLLPIAGDLCHEFPQVKFVLAGNGELEKIRQSVAAAQLQERIRVPGWIEPEPRRQFLGEADLFILPSYDEGLPVALLEAMANGLPVISTHAGGIPELVTDGENGILVAPGDRPALKQAIQKMIPDAGLRAKFGAANRQKIETAYDIKIIAQQVRLLYLRLAR